MERKTLKEIIEFYYAWKKTSHYRQWKGKIDKLKVGKDIDDWVFE